MRRPEGVTYVWYEHLESQADSQLDSICCPHRAQLALALCQLSRQLCIALIYEELQACTPSSVKSDGSLPEPPPLQRHMCCRLLSFRESLMLQHDRLSPQDALPSSLSRSIDAKIAAHKLQTTCNMQSAICYHIGYRSVPGLEPVHTRAHRVLFKLISKVILTSFEIELTSNMLQSQNRGNYELRLHHPTS